MTGNTIAIIFLWLVLSFILGFIPSKIDIEDYTDDENDGVIWVTRNQCVNKVITIFFPHIALIYEVLCEKINGEGLILITLIVLTFTLPLTIILLTLSIIYCLCTGIWHLFCTAYAREDTENDDIIYRA